MPQHPIVERQPLRGRHQGEAPRPQEAPAGLGSHRRDAQGLGGHAAARRDSQAARPMDQAQGIGSLHRPPPPRAQDPADLQGGARGELRKVLAPHRAARPAHPEGAREGLRLLAGARPVQREVQGPVRELRAADRDDRPRGARVAEHLHEGGVRGEAQRDQQGARREEQREGDRLPGFHKGEATRRRRPCGGTSSRSSSPRGGRP